MTEALIGLGGNLGDPHRTLVSASTAIGNLPDTTVIGRSSIYESAPIGPGPQAPYLNAALQIQTGLPARALLEHLQRLEEAHGRERRERWGPRTLDLDILLFGRNAIHEVDLQIPHPRIAERNFVLHPLQDLLGSDARVGGESLRALLERAPRNRLTRTDLPWAVQGKRDCA